MGRALLFLPPILFAALAALFLFGMVRENPDALPSAIAGKAAPAVEVIAFGAEPVLTDAMLRAPGVKLLNFWASWCAPCRAEHAILEELAKSGVTIYGVNYKDKPEQAEGYLAELGNPYAAMGADAGRMAIDWGVYGVPETYVIDGKGRVMLRFPGPLTRQVVDETIRPAMAKAAP